MKHNKNADTLLSRLLFTKSQRQKKKKLKKHSLRVQALKKCEKRRILGIIYHNIYRIPEINFQ